MRRAIPVLLSLGCVSASLEAADYDAIPRLDFNRRAVEVAGAGSAHSHAAAILRAGDAQHIAQHPQQWQVRCHVH